MEQHHYGTPKLCLPFRERATLGPPDRFVSFESFLLYGRSPILSCPVSVSHMKAYLLQSRLVLVFATRRQTRDGRTHLYL